MSFQRCSRCVVPTSRPDTAFVDGVCSACLSYERRPQIDWDERKADLLRLLERHDGKCIVPSSGGKDSHAQVLMLRELGATPTVVTASTCMLTDIGRANIKNLARYATTVEVDPPWAQRAKLNRLGLEMVGDISWGEHVAIFTVPFRMAVDLGIPLMFYGENPQAAYGGPPGADAARVMTRRWVSEFGGFLGLRPSDLTYLAGNMAYYEPPSQADLKRVGVEAHFLGQYLPWDSYNNALKAIEAGMRYQRPCTANWWDFENLDNAMTGIHDHLMYRKYGFGRGAQQVSVSVRNGAILRSSALVWLEDFDGRFPYTYMGVPYQAVLERIGMSNEYFYSVMDQFTNWDIFDKAHRHADGRPYLKAQAANDACA